MRKPFRMFAVLAVAAVAMSSLAGCGRKLSQSPAGPFIPKQELNYGVSYQPVEASNKFALDMYGQTKSEEGNVFFSPFSISSALAMVFEGAKGQTAEEIQKVFYLLPDDAERWAAYRAMLDEINKPDKTYQLKTSNNLWLQQTFPFRQTYIDITTGYYDAESTNMDFVGNPEGSRQTINDTVADQTEDRIQNLLPGGSIQPDTRLVLTNAIYFKADWLYQFLEANTLDRDFFVTPGNPIQVPTMFQKITGRIEDFQGKARVMELLYTGEDVSMLIFLPPEGGMADLEQSLTGDAFAAWMAARPTTLTNYKVDLYLPKFKFDTSYALSDTLKAMGMPTAFEPAVSDLSGMAYLNPGDHLYISSVVHKAFVEVDEKGTEAAAATGVIIGFTSVTSSTPPPPVFRVDHSFLFMIYERSAGVILFMGRVNDPS